MDDLISRIVVFALVGLVSGFASGLFGIGGGIVRVPFFVYLLPSFGVAHPVLMHVAVGTSMALVLPSAIISTRKQYAAGNLDLSFYWTWAVGILIGVSIGIFLMPHVSTEVLQTIFAVFLIAVGLYVALAEDRVVIARSPPRGALKLGVAATIGCVAALTGTGGGTLTTPILRACGMKIDSAIAIASATGLVTGGFATFGAVLSGWHAQDLPVYSLGYVDLIVVAAMIPTIAIAAPLGVGAGWQLSEIWLRRIYSALLFVVAIDLLRRLAL